MTTHHETRPRWSCRAARRIGSRANADEGEDEFGRDTRADAGGKSSDARFSSSKRWRQARTLHCVSETI
eukprot:31075-Pelagococcus_subviridis.AAC.6